MNRLRFTFLLGFICVLNLPWEVRAHADSCLLRISILTCGPGEELYSCYGHSAVRIVDSCLQTDRVYNYGTFNFGEPDFYLKFVRGKLRYYLNEESFADFMALYQYEGRGVSEQVLGLNRQQQQEVLVFLQKNLLPENKFYAYNFLEDNCSTRIRDLFEKILGRQLRWGRAMDDDSCTYRNLLDVYEKSIHWERTGINLLMSHHVDHPIKNRQSFFLPDYLMKGFADARLNGQLFVSENYRLLPQQIHSKPGANTPRLVFWLILFGFLLISWHPRLKKMIPYLDIAIFMLLGLLGCLMLFMWLGTDHEVCAWNRNLLWALPSHLLFAVLITRQSQRIASYARYASGLLMAAMVYSLIATQPYIPEITPILILILLRLWSYNRIVRFQGIPNSWIRK